ncbi:MAG TPA: O-acetyl-ADP-ribose deacetylase [Smithellaceae bacterium]|jgi:O-acetyl-ADP-ribose deacetylase (regulator of RNase III)|nr:O-acetyl-ADP-ribose deacetylase [Smithellaceae bacterium]
MNTTVNQTRIEVAQGDITLETVDAIVNAANSRLAGGGGVDGAIHRAGGPAIMDACRQIGGCATGEAVITTGGNLPARFVIHTVGPVWRGGQHGEAGLLAAAYQNSLALASQKGLQSIAFPAISCGAYGYPVSDAACLALAACMEFARAETGIRLIRHVLFDRVTYDVFAQEFAKRI